VGEYYEKGGEGILTEIQRNIIRIRKISNAQVTLMSGITGGL
jgi:hypothetical protein